MLYMDHNGLCSLTEVAIILLVSVSRRHALNFISLNQLAKEMLRSKFVKIRRLIRHEYYVNLKRSLNIFVAPNRDPVPLC